MVSLRLSPKGIVSPDIPQVAQTDIFSSNLDRIAQSTASEAAKLQQKSEDIFENKFEIQTRETVNNIFNESPDDPDLIKNKIDQYADSVFKSVPSHQSSKLRKVFDSISNPLVVKAFGNKNRILTNDLIVSTEQARDQILIDIQRDSENVLIPDPRLSEDERLIQQTGSLQALETNFLSLKTNLSRIGPDGKPLYSAKDQISILSNAKEVMLSTASKSWLDQQPNKLKALREWSSGDLSIPVFDGEKIVNVPVKHAFNPAVVRKVEKELISRARNEVSMFDKMERKQERLEKRVSDAISKDLFAKAQDGDLSVQEVDDVKNHITPQNFKLSRELAKEKDVITHGPTYVALSIDKMNGKVIEEDVLSYMKDGKLSNKDALSLLKVRENPHTEAKNLLTGLMKTVQSRDAKDEGAIMAIAMREFNDLMEEFKEVNGREPNRSEDNAIAEGIVDTYANRRIVSAIKTPQFNSPALLERDTLTVENVQKSREQAVIFYMKKNEGNRERAFKDPGLRDQLKLLKQWDKNAVQNEKLLQYIKSRGKK